MRGATVFQKYGPIFITSAYFSDIAIKASAPMFMVIAIISSLHRSGQLKYVQLTLDNS